jgi:hypothetical protein
MLDLPSVWIFVARGAKFPSGVFNSVSDAEAWIYKYLLTGVLTKYPIGVGIYDWTVENGFFHPKPNKNIDAFFVGNFSTAYSEHFHYSDGALEN